MTHWLAVADRIKSKPVVGHFRSSGHTVQFHSLSHPSIPFIVRKPSWSIFFEPSDYWGYHTHFLHWDDQVYSSLMPSSRPSPWIFDVYSRKPSCPWGMSLTDLSISPQPWGYWESEFRSLSLQRKHSYSLSHISQFPHWSFLYLLTFLIML